MKTLKDVKVLWSYLEKYKKRVFLIIFAALTSSFLSAGVPYIYGRLVDMAINKDSKAELIFTGLGIWLILTLISNWANRYVVRRGADVGNRASHDLLLKLADHVMRLPVGFHKDKKMGEIIQRIDRAADYFMQIIMEVVFFLVPALLRVVIILGILAYVDWRLSLAILFTLVLYSFVTFLKMKPILKRQKRLNKAFETGGGALYDSTFNFQLVKSSIAEAFENRRNVKNFRSIARKHQFLMKFWMNMSAWQQTIFGAGFVFIFGLGIFFLRSNTLSAGEFVMFVGYTNMVYQPIINLARNYRMLKRAMVVIERALSLFKLQPERYGEGIVLKEIKGEIVFENVSFKYKKGKLILEDITFKAEAGDVVALVGGSGVGKTTLVGLISRYYRTNKGRVMIDGINIQKVNLHSLRKHIAVVPQEISLFNDTIKNNIAYAKPEVTEEEIVRVAKAANAHEFIQKFPKQYEQRVGEKGIKLSTGEKQRIAIARALLRDPRILILDEATSSLDSISEKFVQQALRRLIKGRTVFVIAHRLSTIRDANKILVIENGKVAEQGTHKQLIKKGGTYQKFYHMQSMDFPEQEGFFQKD